MGGHDQQVRLQFLDSPEDRIARVTFENRGLTHDPNVVAYQKRLRRRAISASRSRSRSLMSTRPSSTRPSCWNSSSVLVYRLPVGSDDFRQLLVGKVNLVSVAHPGQS